MSTSTHPPEHWAPVSEADRELVLKELEAILVSYHFRGSKRYPAMLKYVVDAALEGRSANLKERTLGVEVFGRDPDYDTSADPVVRFSASEVRKRIAQYYHENGNGKRLQIELPLGSYVPEFTLLTGELPDPLTPFDSEGLNASRPLQRKRSRLKLAVVLPLAALLLAASVAGIYAYRRFTAPKPTVSDKLWAPLEKSTGPIVIVVGTSHNARKLTPEAAETSFLDHMTGPYHHVSVAIATALANVAGTLRLHGSAYEIKEDAETSLTDLRSHPLILIGATNNAWTMRLVSPLRFHFIPGPLAQIQDAKNPQNEEWLIDFSKPYSSITVDYAIVARFHDPTTEGPVMVIAGIGPYGTEAASAFVSTPRYLEQIATLVPAGWENKNLEMILKTDVIEGKPGPPVLVASTVW
jgi:hypothetical protein